MLDLTLLLATPIARLLLDQFFEGAATIEPIWDLFMWQQFLR